MVCARGIVGMIPDLNALLLPLDCSVSDHARRLGQRLTASCGVIGQDGRSGRPPLHLFPLWDGASGPAIGAEVGRGRCTLRRPFAQAPSAQTAAASMHQLAPQLLFQPLECLADRGGNAALCRVDRPARSGLRNRAHVSEVAPSVCRPGYAVEAEAPRNARYSQMATTKRMVVARNCR